MKKHLTFPPSIRSSISLQIRCRLDVDRNSPPSELAYSSIFVVKGTKAVFPAHNLAPPLKNGSEPVEPDLSGARPDRLNFWSLKYEYIRFRRCWKSWWLEIKAIYTELSPVFQTIPALPTASNACSKEKSTFYSVSWIKRQWHAVCYI